ncbi:hypothetical protein VW23_002530 [Devosia insulae DS-56]|uniref:Uncharacterized protein n=1 Tax=Devosia insulae DS-56 TaxID=1116389 RepID=A0A1E5XKG8_9HYPH|nr:hypothetical protein [Devosia insulae]OEO29088.1 hypothetical protein VW23_002530 [Devosia insulae DS-56]
MAGYGLLALAHAAVRGHRRIAGDVRTVAGLDMVAQIEAEHALWWQRGEPHPADAGADHYIARMLAAIGAGLALRRPIHGGRRRRA